MASSMSHGLFDCVISGGNRERAAAAPYGDSAGGDTGGATPGGKDRKNAAGGIFLFSATGGCDKMQGIWQRMI